MSFASDVKFEICKEDITEVCCARAELAGMVCFGATIRSNEIKLRTENALVAQRFCNLIEYLYNIKIDLRTMDSGMHTAIFSGSEVIKVLRDMRLVGVPLRIDKDIIRNECCKSAFLKGVFLGGGSMIDPLKGYHIELVTSHYSIEKDLRAVFEHFELYPKMINRNGNYVFYIKESQQIENMMVAVGAFSKMMEFVNIVIERDLKNSTNRLVNFEVANYNKIYATAEKQKLAIKKIVLEHGWQSLSPELAEVAKLRLKDGYMSMSQMAEKLGITKSGINHRMRKILALAEMED